MKGIIKFVNFTFKNYTERRFQMKEIGTAKEFGSLVKGRIEDDRGGRDDIINDSL